MTTQEKQARWKAAHPDKIRRSFWFSKSTSEALRDICRAQGRTQQRYVERALEAQLRSDLKAADQMALAFHSISE